MSPLLAVHVNSENNSPARVRSDIRKWLQLAPPSERVEFTVVDVHEDPAFNRKRITYEAQDGGSISAFLLVPHALSPPASAVVVHHQHNGERHIGKSEVCGLVGDRFQAFGPALAAKGIFVLAPDSICFEDRRSGAAGTAPHPDDWQQHYNQMSYRLLRGDTLMRKVLEDAETAVSLHRTPSSAGCLGIGRRVFARR